MLVVAVVIILLITVLVFFGIGVHWYLKKSKDDAKAAVRMVVDEVNKVNYYTYNYEKAQGQNVKNIDTNVQRLASVVESLRTDVLALQRTTPTNVGSKPKPDNLQGVSSKEIEIGNVKFSYEPDTSELVLEANGDEASHLVTDNLRVNNELEVRNNLTVEKGISSNHLINGPMFEVRDEMTNARYGVGQFPGGTTRVYSPNYIALATVNNSGTYQDALTASSTRVNISKPLCFNDSVCIVTNGRRLMACPASNPDPMNTDCTYIS